MIDFHKLTLSQKAAYEAVLFSEAPRGCEYAFANLFLWGRQQAAQIHGCLVFFSHFGGRSIYPYPIGTGDKKAAISAILEDARERGIPCRITNVLPHDRAELESWFPGKFIFQTHRDTYDYVYDIQGLADLGGRKFQKKRNHCNRFRTQHPDCAVLPLTAQNMECAQSMAEQWYLHRAQTDPQGDYLLESIAMGKAFRHFDALGMEGIVLMEQGRILAVTMGSRLSADTFDIHFEKAREDIDGAYAAVNQAFAGYLRQRHPELRYLNREDDLGLEGLRSAKLSYHPAFLVEKCWAFLEEDIHAD